MRTLAIDPGTTQSAWIVLQDGIPQVWRIDQNDFLLSLLLGPFAPFDDPDSPCEHLAIEGVESFGMAVGKEVFETVFWSGRFVQAWGKPFTRVYRKEVKLHFCNSVRAKDQNVRQAIIDQHGGKDAAIGRKATPGPLYGISSHCWSALAVGLTFEEATKPTPPVVI